MAKHHLDCDGVVHCEENGGAGYTLCGLALEGERGATPMTDTAARINCGECVAIIKFCQRVRAGEFESTARALR